MTYTTKNVDTTELRLGDIVHDHGGRFELTMCLLGEAEAAERATYVRQYPNTGDTPEETERAATREQTLRCFGTRYLGPMDERWPCSVPNSWRDSAERPDGWHIQGNCHAVWTVEVTA